VHRPRMTPKLASMHLISRSGKMPVCTFIVWLPIAAAGTASVLRTGGLPMAHKVGEGLWVRQCYRWVRA
jgi:hypothetical protein